MAFGPNIAKALLSLQAKAPQIIKNQEADAVKFKYMYASLPDIFAIFKPLLTEMGILIMQPTATKVHGGVAFVGVSTQLVHVESMEDVCTDSLSTPAKDPQDLGKVITYLRRYQFNSLLGIAPAGEDDDCVLITKDADPVLSIKLAEIKRLVTLTKTDPDAVKLYFGVKYFDELTDVQQDDCIATLLVKAGVK